MMTLCNIPDHIVADLHAKKRVKGSVGLINDKEIDFNAYNCAKPQPHTIYKLPHGEASIRGKCAHLHLRIDMEHEKVDVGNAMFTESAEAQLFFDELTNELRDV